MPGYVLKTKSQFFLHMKKFQIVKCWPEKNTIEIVVVNIGQ